MKIRFEIDPSYDAKKAMAMLRRKDWKYRAARMGIVGQFAQEINEAPECKMPELEARLSASVITIYQDLGLYIEESKNQYQESWNEIMEEFSSRVEEISCPWFYDEYVCIVTHLNPGISNWNGNVVGRWWKENAFTQRKITAHEILIAHYFSIHRNQYKDSGLTDRQIWALAEIAAFALTGLEPRLSKFWPWDKSGYDTSHNYPQLVSLQQELQEPFLQRTNFDEYIRVGIESVKKYQGLV